MFTHRAQLFSFYVLMNGCLWCFTVSLTLKLESFHDLLIFCFSKQLNLEFMAKSLQGSLRNSNQPNWRLHQTFKTQSTQFTIESTSWNKFLMQEIQLRCKSFLKCARITNCWINNSAQIPSNLFCNEKSWNSRNLRSSKPAEEEQTRKLMFKYQISI